MDAMEEGILPVVAKQWGYTLWEFYILTTDQWVRMCAMLQRNRLPSRLLWGLSYVHYTWGSADGVYSVFTDPDAVAALTRIEFLWQDSDAVQAWIKSHAVSWDVDWVVAAEVYWRQQLLWTVVVS
jgi:hypothetical protein